MTVWECDVTSYLSSNASSITWTKNVCTIREVLLSLYRMRKYNNEMFGISLLNLNNSSDTRLKKVLIYNKIKIWYQ